MANLKRLFYAPNSPFFNWQDYLTTTGASEFYKIALVEQSSTRVENIIIPAEEPTLFFKQIWLNKRICHLDKTPAFSFRIDFSERKLELKIYWYYEGTEKYRVYGETPTLPGGLSFRIEDKYKAIELDTGSIYAFAGVLRAIGNTSIRKVLIDKFKALLYQVNRKNQSNSIGFTLFCLTLLFKNLMPVYFGKTCSCSYNTTKANGLSRTAIR